METKKVLIIFFLVSFLSINFSFSQLENISRFQPNMPCGTLNTSLRWSNGIEDLKDILIMQLLIQEGRYSDLQSFLVDQGYVEVTDDYYMKALFTKRESFSIIPIIEIKNGGKSLFGDDKNDIYLNIMLNYAKDGTGFGMEVNQQFHNGIYVMISNIMSRGLPWRLFTQTRELFEKENKKRIADSLSPERDIEYIGKYKLKVTNRESGEVEEFKASNTLGIGNDFNSQFLNYFFKESRILNMRIGTLETKEGDACKENILISTLTVYTDARDIDKPLDVKLFKSLSNLNEIIWAAEGSN